MPKGMMNLTRSSLSSLSDQSPMSIGAPVVLYSSMVSTSGKSVCVNTSLITTVLIGPAPAAPGVPPYSLLDRQWPGSL